MTRKIVLLVAVALIGACSSSDEAKDGSAGDIIVGDIIAGDIGKGDLDAAGCAPNEACEEECLDAKATQPPLFAWTSSWKQPPSAASNASFSGQLTTEDRRCQWSSLNDSCTIYNCLASEWTGAAATMKGISAGTFTVQNESGKGAVLSPDADNVYSLKFWNTEFWKAGDRITYTAEGATIPAFSLTIDFPAVVEADNPLAQDAGAIFEIDRGTAMTFTWTPTDEKVIVMFAQVPSSTATDWDRQELWCIFDGDAGTGTVPVDVLARLREDMGVSTYSIAHYKRRCYDVGGYHIQATGVSGVWWDATVK